MAKRRGLLTVVIAGGLAACAGTSVDADGLFGLFDAGELPGAPSEDVGLLEASTDAGVGDASVVDVNSPDGGEFDAADATATKPDASDASHDATKPDASDASHDATKPDASDASYDATKPAENSNALCGDGLDNDGDGFVDCLDNECWANGLTVCIKTEVTNATCSDGIDNDGDGFSDCDDYGCSRSWIVTVCGKDASADARVDGGKEGGP
jgi:hypothetical protein